jgi:hypothetical protein
MAHFLDITGAFLYLAFRVIIIPVLVWLSLFFLLLALIKAALRLVKWIGAIKFRVIQPSYLFARIRFASGK